LCGLGAGVVFCAHHQSLFGFVFFPVCFAFPNALLSNKNYGNSLAVPFKKDCGFLLLALGSRPNLPNIYMVTIIQFCVI
jgi:hypothetical protein